MSTCFDEPIHVPTELHGYFSEWFSSLVDDNLLLWGCDDDEWLMEAFESIASMEGNNRAVHIRCQGLCFGENFSNQLSEAICSCCYNMSHWYLEKPQEPSCNAIKTLDSNLGSVIPVLIYGLDSLPSQDLKRGGQTLREIEALLEAVHFRVIITGSRRVPLGYPESCTTVDYIEELWKIRPLYLR